MIRVEEKIQWQISVPIFKNNLILKQLALAIGIPFGILIFVLIVLTKGSMYTVYSVGMIIGLLVFTWIFILIVYRGKYDVEFLLDSKGLLYKNQGHQMKKNAIINGLTFFLALLSRKSTLAGTSILAQSKQEIFISWKEVTKIRYKANSKTILLKAGLLDNMALFCTKENYSMVEEFIRSKTIK